MNMLPQTIHFDDIDTEGLQKMKIILSKDCLCFVFLVSFGGQVGYYTTLECNFEVVL